MAMTAANRVESKSNQYLSIDTRALGVFMILLPETLLVGACGFLALLNRTSGLPFLAEISVSLDCLRLVQKQIAYEGLDTGKKR